MGYKGKGNPLIQVDINGEVNNRLDEFDAQLTQTEKKIRPYMRTNTQAEGQRYEAPNFVKHASNPIFTRDDSAFLTTNNWKLYWPWVIQADAVLNENALDKFYMYYSCDHASNEGGIGLATAPHPLGPWTDYGRVFYDDTVDVGQTETPSVVWNPSTQEFHLYYHAIGAGRMQSTCLATSPDGISNWTKRGVMVDVPEYEYPGDGHTGYARVYRTGNQWVMMHLMGGQKFSHQGVSYSEDGFVWQTDPRPFTGFVDLASNKVDRRIEYHNSYPFYYRGETWIVMTETPYISGLESAEKRLIIGKMPSQRRITNVSNFLPMGATGEFDETSMRQPHVISYEDKLYLFYSSDGTDGNGAIGVAEEVV